MRARAGRSSRSVRPVIGTSSTMIVPLVGVSSALMSRTSVLLPAPEYPMTPKTSPRSISTLTLSTARTGCAPAVNSLDTLRRETIAVTSNPSFVSAAWV